MQVAKICDTHVKRHNGTCTSHKDSPVVFQGVMWCYCSVVFGILIILRLKHAHKHKSCLVVSGDNAVIDILINRSLCWVVTETEKPAQKHWDTRASTMTALLSHVTFSQGESTVEQLSMAFSSTLQVAGTVLGCRWNTETRSEHRVCPVVSCDILTKPRRSNWGVLGQVLRSQRRDRRRQAKGSSVEIWPRTYSRSQTLTDKFRDCGFSSLPFSQVP